LQLPDIVLCSSSPKKGLFDLPLAGKLPQRLWCTILCLLLFGGGFFFLLFFFFLIIASSILKDLKYLPFLSTVFFAAVAKQPVIYLNSAAAV